MYSWPFFTFLWVPLSTSSNATIFTWQSSSAEGATGRAAHQLFDCINNEGDIVSNRNRNREANKSTAAFELWGRNYLISMTQCKTHSLVPTVNTLTFAFILKLNMPRDIYCLGKRKRRKLHGEMKRQFCRFSSKWMLHCCCNSAIHGREVLTVFVSIRGGKLSVVAQIQARLSRGIAFAQGRGKHCLTRRPTRANRDGRWGILSKCYISLDKSSMQKLAPL